MAVLLDIVEEHAEQAAFLWDTRAAAVDAPHYDLADLAKLDERIEAHLDGLRIAAATGADIAEAACKGGDPAAVFVAGVLSIGQGRDRPVVSASESPKAASGLVAALAWVPWDQARHFAERLLDGTPVHRGIALAAFTAHGRDPGSSLEAAIDDADPWLRARALRAAGELRRADLTWAIRRRLEDDDEECRYQSAWALTVLDQGADALLALGLRGREPVETAIRWHRDAREWTSRLLADPGPSAMMAAGALGEPAFVPALVEAMVDSRLARLAGEAFALLTGADLVAMKLEISDPPPAGGPNDDPADPFVAMDADEDLPWPDPHRVAAWWERHRLPDGVRHLLGRPVSRESVASALRIGFQRQRAGAALESARLDPGAPIFDVRTPARWQRARLG